MGEEEKVPEKERNFLVSLGLKIAPFLIIFLFGVGATVYLARQKPEILGLSKGQAQVQAEVDALVTEVGKLITLPSDEKPTVATITDVEKLKDQPFFVNAQNGDKVLIYTNAKKAILYRSEEKKIIEVGAVNINQQAGESPSPTPTATPTPKPES